MPSGDRMSPLPALTRGRRPRALGVAVATFLPLVGVVALCLAASVAVPVLLVSVDYWLRYGGVE